MIIYLAVFALGAVLGALALLWVMIIMSPDEDMIIMSPDEDIRLWNKQERVETLDQQDEIRRRYESECI